MKDKFGKFGLYGSIAILGLGFIWMVAMIGESANEQHTMNACDQHNQVTLKGVVYICQKIHAPGDSK